MTVKLLIKSGLPIGRPTLVKTWASDNSTTPASFVKSTYNGAGQTVFTSFPSTSSNPTAGTNMVYDGLGRIVTSTENVAPLAQTKHEYYSSHLHRVYDPSNNYTDYFSLGFSGPGNEDYRAIYRHGVGGYQQYTYLYKNVWGQMEELRQWGSEGGVSVDKSRYYSFDTQQRLCRYREDEGNSALYAYDAAGQMTDYSQGETNAAGCGAMTPAKRTTLYYDALGRNFYTDFWTSGTLDTVKTFDDNSNVLTLKRGQGSGAAGPDTVYHTYTYGTLNNLTSEKLELDGRTYDLGYNYNANGHVTSRTVQSHGASLRTNPYGVDGLGRHTFAKNNGSNAVLDIRYHPNNMIESYDLANNQEFTQTLNARLMPEHITTINGAHKALDMAYLYDVRGKVTSLTDNSTSVPDVRTFTYDPLGQLKTSVGPWGAGSYTYDSLGNILAKTEGTRAMVMSYNNTTNRLTSHTDTVGGSRSLSYDERGNVTALGAQNFVYDLRNQPKSISGTASGTYEYDGNKKRVKSVVDGKTLYFVYDASGKLMIVDRPDFVTPANNERVYYLHAAGKTMLRYTHRDNSSNSIDYLHADHLGSANSASGSAGTVKWREQYSPFGERLSQIAANDDLDGFTGHVFDKATGLNYMQARYYDPLIGRFLSIDPVGFEATGHPGMFNRYAYVLNDPINGIDPDGALCKVCMTPSRQTTKVANYAINHPKQAASMAVGGAIIVADILTIPSGEGAVGAAMIASARAAAAGAATATGLDAAEQYNSADSLSDIDWGESFSKAPGGAIKGLIALPVFKTAHGVIKGVKTDGVKRLTETFKNSKVAEKFDKFSDYVAAKGIGAGVAGGIVNQATTRDAPKDDFMTDRATRIERNEQ